MIPAPHAVGQDPEALRLAQAVDAAKAGRPKSRSVIYRRSLLTVVVPLLALALVALLLGGHEWRGVGEFARVQSMSDMMSRIADSVHALQIERGTSTAVIRSTDGAFADRLSGFRASTDDYLASLDLTETLNLAPVAAALERARREIRRLPALRAAVDARRIDDTEVVDRYAELVRSLIELNAVISLEVNASDVATNMRALRDVTQFKELAGLERAMGLALIAAPREQAPVLRDRLNKTIAQQEIFARVLASNPSSGAAGDLARLDMFTNRVEELRPKLLGIVGDGDRLPLLEQWFAISTERVDELRSIENKLIRRITELAHDNRRRADAGLVAIIGLLIGAVVFSIAAALGGARAVAHPVREMTEVLTRIARGDRLITIEATRYRGEIRDMANAAVAFRDHLLRSQAIVDSAIDAIVSIDAAGRIIEFNPSAEALFGHAADRAIGQDMATLLIPEASRARHHAGFARLLGGGAPSILGRRVEVKGLRADGSEVPIDLLVNEIEMGGQRVFTAFMADISERRAAQAQLVKVRSAVEQNPTSIVITDAEGRIEYVNRSFSEVTGYGFGEVRGKNPRILQSGLTPAETYRELWETIKAGQSWRGELHNRKKSGELFWEDVQISPISVDGDGTTHFVAIREDLTQRKEYEAKLLRQAHYDDVTGLPNRLLALDRMQQALTSAKRNDRQVGVLFLDIDHFKKINDSLGHVVGDRLLAAIGLRLKTEMRASDTIARLGGDEFLMVLADVEAASFAEAAALRISKLLGASFLVDGHEIFVTVSIGITMGPADGSEPMVLLKNADAANARVKSFGRDAYRFFVPDMDEASQARRRIESQLYHALERKELFLAYHPIIEAVGGRTVGAEALIRWRNPDLGFVGPDKFISLAEDNGLIVPIGHWVIAEACRVAAAWRRKPGQERFRVAVNVSARQFRDSAVLIDSIREALEVNGLSPDALEVEVTESITAESNIEILPALETLSRQDIRLSIDDFGTGYSSLGYLQRFPFTTLKIDRSFVDGAPADAKRRALLDAMVAMAHGLGLEVVAEGVETPSEKDLLRELGCDLLQGFLFSKPLVEADFERFLDGQAAAVQLSF